MAIFRLSITTIKRSKGQSVVQQAALISGGKLFDKRLGKTFNYEKKKNLIHSEILLPVGAPACFKDRELLWNEVEEASKRKDAQLARLVKIALPSELTDKANRDLLKEYCLKQFVQLGMIADINFRIGESNNQPHADVLLTLRDVSSNGFGLSNRTWNKRENVTIWRKEWANLCNKYLELHGCNVRIDHRSYKEQGIDLLPQGSVGISIARAQREKNQGLPLTSSDRLHERDAIREINGNRIIDNPDIALKILSNKHGVITNNAIKEFALGQSINDEHCQAVYQAIIQSPRLIQIEQCSQEETCYRYEVKE